MLKIMKYELRKDIITKTILLAVTMAFELLFLIAIAANTINAIEILSTIIFILFLIGMVIAGLEPANVFHKDISKKQGYLLFMTPNTYRRILCAKLMLAASQVVATFSLFIGILALNQKLISIRFGIEVNLIDQVTDVFGDVGFSFGEYIVTTFSTLLVMTSLIALAFLSISISYTLNPSSKLHVWFSILIFIGLLLVEMSIMCAIGVGIIDSIKVDEGSLSLLFQLFIAIIFGIPTIINYFITVNVLEKKLSM